MLRRRSSMSIPCGVVRSTLRRSTRANASCSHTMASAIRRVLWRSNTIEAMDYKAASTGERPCSPSPHKLLPVAFLGPRVGVVVVAALLPETRTVALHKLQAIKPLGTFVKVKLWHQQAYRSTVLRLQILTIMFESDHHIIVIKVSKREIRRIARPGVRRHKFCTRQRFGAP